MSATGLRHARYVAPIVALAMLVAACASPPPSASPTSVPTPVVTPNPHLAAPATARDVFIGLGRAGLRMTPNTAAAGIGDAAVVTRINATYLDWPLDVFQFRTAGHLAEAIASWDTSEGPGSGDPAISLVGLNILVTWGPRTTGETPEPPDERRAKALRELVAALEPLLSPLRARTVVAIELAVAPTPAPTSAANPAATPAAAPETTPAP